MALPDLASGAILAGKYRVDRIVGEGGIGVVVAAEHLGLGKPVAVKLLHIDADERMIARFQREARALGGLSSPHVPQMFDIDRLPTGEPYLVMELLVGCDLAELLRRQGKLRVAEAVDYVRQACEALAEAHALGIVHRDLKPANLFLTHDARGGGVIKVLDFGMAKLTSELESARQVALTRTGSFFGSPAYMAPEQWVSARQADARSDVWSMGCVLYELTTGRLPFEGDNLSDLFRITVETDAPSPRSLRAELTPELDAVIMRCLHKDPARRYADGRELERALAAVTITESTATSGRGGAPSVDMARSSPTALGPTIAETLPGAQPGALPPAAAATWPSASQPAPATTHPPTAVPYSAYPTFSPASYPHPSASSAARQTVAHSASLAGRQRRSRGLVALLVGAGVLAVLLAIVALLLVPRILERPSRRHERPEETDGFADEDSRATPEAIAAALEQFGKGLRQAGGPRLLLSVTISPDATMFVVPGATRESPPRLYTLPGGEATGTDVPPESYQVLRPFSPSRVDPAVVQRIIADALAAAGNPPEAMVEATLSQLGATPLQWSVVVIPEGEADPLVRFYDPDGR